ncbi:MAG: 6-phosphofructokinase [Bacteroidales bacterium]|nr:6-phosphofructokinase [Bacteroidales bacterium]MCB8998594.1 6-phosphofructokinase [Bacteroidales bacterium]MCB9012538.1 6-phosphofructokinase [Bacteroidales bacterium]
MKDAVAILCAGGPAPGINTVISSVTKIFLQNGFQVLGINGGYKSLFSSEPAFDYLDFEYADQIYSRGGSALKMSRYKPKDEEFKVDFFRKNNVKILVTIGGDDTASTANRLAKYLLEQKMDVKNIHVPKTIDNDLPLPEGTPTFGYHSAKEEGVRIASTIYEDARTSGNWFVVSCMGREAGHLAFGVGTACHFPMIIIPEMFDKTKLTFDKITNLVISSMVKRRLLGIDYGVAIISEGVFHFMKDEEIIETGINFTYDDHGHPELGNVSKSHIFNMLVQQKLKTLRISVKSRPNEMGYELRCCRPIAYDLNYATRLGLGVYKLYQKGLTGCMVTIDRTGEISPLFLKDVEDEKGKVKPRLVNIDTEKVQLIYRNNLHFITPADYRGAKKYVQDPEEFDFFKILNWSETDF